MLVLQPEVVQRAALEALAVEVRDELSSRDAPVERRVVAALRDGTVQPRRSLHVGVEEARRRDPRAPVRQHTMLHASSFFFETNSGGRSPPTLHFIDQMAWGQGRVDKKLQQGLKNGSKEISDDPRS